MNSQRHPFKDLLIIITLKNRKERKHLKMHLIHNDHRKCALTILNAKYKNYMICKTMCNFQHEVPSVTDSYCNINRHLLNIQSIIKKNSSLNTGSSYPMIQYINLHSPPQIQDNKASIGVWWPFYLNDHISIIEHTLLQENYILHHPRDLNILNVKQNRKPGFFLKLHKIFIEILKAMTRFHDYLYYLCIRCPLYVYNI